MRTISELTIFEIADYAALFYLAVGTTRATASLVYHGLNMNFNHVKLLICMFDLFVEKAPPFAACTLEYIMKSGFSLDDYRDELAAKRTSAMWIWGLCLKQDGGNVATMGEIVKHTGFVYDEVNYQKLVNATAEQAGTLEQVVRGSHLFLGYISELMVYKDPGREFNPEDIYHPEHFVEGPQYAKWLNSPVQELEETVQWLRKSKKEPKSKQQRAA
jgi:hypothetical protein